MGKRKKGDKTRKATTGKMKGKEGKEKERKEGWKGKESKRKKGMETEKEETSTRDASGNACSTYCGAVKPRRAYEKEKKIKELAVRDIIATLL